MASSNYPVGDPRKAGEAGPAGDVRKAGETGQAGDPRKAGDATVAATSTSTTDTPAGKFPAN